MSFAPLSSFSSTSSGSCSSVFPSVTRLLSDLESEFEEFSRSSQSGDSSGLQRKFQAAFGEISKLEILIDKETTNKREIWRARIKPLNDRSQELWNSFRNAADRRDREARRKAVMGEENGRPRDRQKEKAELRTNESLSRSIDLIDELSSLGSDSLSSLHSQRSLFKRFHRKVLDSAAAIGLSNSLINFIERREKGNFAILCLGMFTTLVVLGILYYYKGK